MRLLTLLCFYDKLMKSLVSEVFTGFERPFVIIAHQVWEH